MNKPDYDIKVAVVILNWNGKKYLEQFIPVLIKNSNSDNVWLYVADNGSKDDSLSFLQNNFPEIKIIRLEKNYGFAEGYNRALRKINAEYYVILNSDVEVSSNWIFPVINKMDNDKKVAAAMPKIKSYRDKSYFEYAGAAGGFIDKFGYPFCQGRILDTVEKDEGQYNTEREIFWASGACMFVRSEVFHEQGAFDSDFFAHMEEIDLSWRMKNAGYKIMYYPDVEVYHVGGGALPNDSPFKLYLNFRNNLFMLYKNLPKESLFKIVFIRMVLDGASALVYLLKFSFGSFSAVFRAHISFYKSMKRLNKKRAKLLKNNVPSTHKEQYPHSIIYHFFIKKQKTFKNISF